MLLRPRHPACIEAMEKLLVQFLLQQRRSLEDGNGEATEQMTEPAFADYADRHDEGVLGGEVTDSESSESPCSVGEKAGDNVLKLRSAYGSSQRHAQ